MIFPFTELRLKFIRVRIYTRISGNSYCTSMNASPQFQFESFVQFPETKKTERSSPSSFLSPVEGEGG